MKSFLIVAALLASFLVFSSGCAIAQELKPLPLIEGDMWTYRQTIESPGKAATSSTILFGLASFDDKNQVVVALANEIRPGPNTMWRPIYAISRRACMLDISGKRALAEETVCLNKQTAGSTWEFQDEDGPIRVSEKFNVIGQEEVQVPDGIYQATKIESIKTVSKLSGTKGSSTKNEEKIYRTIYWYVPEVKAMAKVLRELPGDSGPNKKMTEELLKFQPGNINDYIRREKQSVCAPEYPEEALRYNLQGTVLLSLLVNTEGKIKDSKILKSSGWKVLDDATLQAFSRCAFKPAIEDGKPVESWTKIRYVWKVQDVIGPDGPPMLAKGSCSTSTEFTVDETNSVQPSIGLRFLVDYDGHPYDIKMEGSSNDEIADKAAIKFLQTCMFSIAVQNGKRVQGGANIRLVRKIPAR